MTQETIVLTTGREMPQDILALGQQMKPAGMTLQMMPPIQRRSWGDLVGVRLSTVG
jgi:hypothetical protein